MKHLMTLLALVVAVTAEAQTGLVEFPYNPDADNDDVIGTADLLALLSLYGSEFSEENLYLNTDSSSALYHASADMSYYDCHRVCHELPGNWRIASRDDFYKTDITMLDQGVAWVRTDLSSNFPYNHTEVGPYYWAIFVGYSNSNNGRVSYGTYSGELNCYCATHERPKVEYSYCEGAYAGDSEFQSCCETKVAAGWYPLGSLNTNAGSVPSQAFWRWAE